MMRPNAQLKRRQYEVKIDTVIYNYCYFWGQYIQDLPCFVVGFDFYPTSCAFSIPKPWRGDRSDDKLDKNHM